MLASRNHFCILNLSAMSRPVSMEGFTGCALTMFPLARWIKSATTLDSFAFLDGTRKTPFCRFLYSRGLTAHRGGRCVASASLLSRATASSRFSHPKQSHGSMHANPAAKQIQYPFLHLQVLHVHGLLFAGPGRDMFGGQFGRECYICDIFK